MKNIRVEAASRAARARQDSGGSGRSSSKASGGRRETPAPRASGSRASGGTSPRSRTSAGKAASGSGARKPAAKPTWRQRRPPRPVHPPTPLDEMAGLVLVAAGILIAVLCIYPDWMGALEPVGGWLNDELGMGRFAVSAFILLIGCEAFTPHQALGVPMLIVGLGVLWGCMQVAADLMGGQGGAIGRSLAQTLETGIGVPGAWIATVTTILIDLQWVTRISLRGPACVLALPLRLGWRLGRFAGHGVQAGWRSVCENWERVKLQRDERRLERLEGNGYLAEIEARRDRDRKKGSAPEFPPMRTAEGTGETKSAKAGKAEKAPRAEATADVQTPSKAEAAPADEEAQAVAATGGRRRGPAGEEEPRGPIFPDYPMPGLADGEDAPEGAAEPGSVVQDVRAREKARPDEEPEDEFDIDASDDVEIPGYEEDDPRNPDSDETLLDAPAAFGDDIPPWDVPARVDADEDPADEASSGFSADGVDPIDDADEQPRGARRGEPSRPAVGGPRIEALTLWDEEELAAAAPPPPRRQIQYRLPALDLLEEYGGLPTADNGTDFSRVIVETLNSFGVATRIVNVEKGPTVTRYELQPARGVKVSKITSLNNDIALALAAQSIRIEAPIPGKSAIGIEVPNSKVEAVRLREILESGGFSNGNGLMLALGKDISGRSVVADLLRAPHLLIAGATGSGKSVCLNTVIVSLLYKCTPQQLQMVMVDPKRVELSIFEGIPHLANTHANPNSRIVKDAKTGTLVLKQATEIMNQRFELLSRSRVRNISEYNAKSDVPMPYLVIIVDELAQLMQISARSVEGYLQELAQMGRAAGIHLILATQRPSVDVLTGTIKSNFPARIAFAVSAQVDSRTILDRGGAEKLLGRGDMLFSPTDSELRRVQGALITLEETERVVDFWRAQESPDNLVPLSLEAKSPEEMLGQGAEGEDEDLLKEAVRIIRDTKLASASNLQRKLQIGYPRAARLVDELEVRGFLGPANGSKPRKILFLDS